MTSQKPYKLTPYDPVGNTSYNRNPTFCIQLTTKNYASSLSWEGNHALGLLANQLQHICMLQLLLYRKCSHYPFPSIFWTKWRGSKGNPTYIELKADWEERSNELQSMALFLCRSWATSWTAETCILQKLVLPLPRHGDNPFHYSYALGHERNPWIKMIIGATMKP